MKERALDVFCMLLVGIAAGVELYLVYEFRSVILP